MIIHLNLRNTKVWNAPSKKLLIFSKFSHYINEGRGFRGFCVDTPFSVLDFVIRVVKRFATFFRGFERIHTKKGEFLQKIV